MSEKQEEIPVVKLQIGKKVFFDDIKKDNININDNINNTTPLNFNSSIFDSKFNSDFIRASNSKSIIKENNISDEFYNQEDNGNIAVENIELNTNNEPAIDPDEPPISAYENDARELDDSLDFQYNTQNKKSNFINLSWFLLNSRNANIDIKDKTIADLCTISFNIDFGNIRVDFFKKTENSFYNNVAFLDKFERLCYGTIYPGSLMRFIYSTEEEYSYTCMEQLYNFTGEEWQYNRPLVKIIKNNSEIRINITSYNERVFSSKYEFVFTTWQIDGLRRCFEFAINNGMLATANSMINFKQH